MIILYLFTLPNFVICLVKGTTFQTVTVHFMPLPIIDACSRSEHDVRLQAYHRIVSYNRIERLIDTVETDTVKFVH